MSTFAEHFSASERPIKKQEAPPERRVTEKPDDGLGMLRHVASMSHGKRKKEYEAALKKADEKKV